MSDISNTHYVDGLGRVTVINGMVYVNLLQLTPGDKIDDVHSYHSSSRLIFNLPSYIKFCADVSEQLKELEKAGIITKKE